MATRLETDGTAAHTIEVNKFEADSAVGALVEEDVAATEILVEKAVVVQASGGAGHFAHCI